MRVKVRDVSEKTGCKPGPEVEKPLVKRWSFLK